MRNPTPFPITVDELHEVAAHRCLSPEQVGMYAMLAAAAIENPGQALRDESSQFFLWNAVRKRQLIDELCEAGVLHRHFGYILHLGSRPVPEAWTSRSGGEPDGFTPLTDGVR